MNFKYPYFDAHCDTLTALYKDKASLNNSKYMVNLSGQFLVHYLRFPPE